jgi:PAS domain S-box-containing protein
MIDRGWLGGVLAVIVGVGFTGAWSAYAGVDVGPLGYGARAVAFVVVAVIVDCYATQRRALERGLERAYDVAGDLHCTASFDGYFRRVDPAGRRLLGYTEPELLARPFLEFVHPDDQSQTLHETERLVSGEDCTVNFENRYCVGRSGVGRWRGRFGCPRRSGGRRAWRRWH